MSMIDSGWWRDDRQPGYKKPRRRPQMLEQREQRFLFDWLRATRWQGQPLADYAYHPANGGWRSAAEGGIFKAIGVKPGIPDVCLTIAASGFHGAYVELKRPDGRGRLTDDQIRVQAMLREQGYAVGNANTWHAAAAFFCDYLKLPEQYRPIYTPTAQEVIRLRRKGQRC